MTAIRLTAHQRAKLVQAVDGRKGAFCRRHEEVVAVLETAGLATVHDAGVGVVWLRATADGVAWVDRFGAFEPVTLPRLRAELQPGLPRDEWTE